MSRYDSAEKNRYQAPLVLPQFHIACECPMFSLWFAAGRPCWKIRRNFEWQFFPAGHINVSDYCFYINYVSFSIILLICLFKNFPFLILKQRLLPRWSPKLRNEKKPQRLAEKRTESFMRFFTECYQFNALFSNCSRWRNQHNRISATFSLQVFIAFIASKAMWQTFAAAYSTNSKLIRMLVSLYR